MVIRYNNAPPQIKHLWGCFWMLENNIHQSTGSASQNALKEQVECSEPPTSWRWSGNKKSWDRIFYKKLCRCFWRRL